MKINFDEYKIVLSIIETEAGLEYLAEYREFDFCCGGGRTADEAIKEARENLEIYIAEMQDLGKDIPEPIRELNYSGKLTFRLSKSMHKKATECAEREGVSLNAFIAEAVSEKVGNTSLNYVLSKLDVAVERFTAAIYLTKAVVDTAVTFNRSTAQTINQFGFGSIPQFKLN